MSDDNSQDEVKLVPWLGASWSAPDDADPIGDLRAYADHIYSQSGYSWLKRRMLTQILYGKSHPIRDRWRRWKNRNTYDN